MRSEEAGKAKRVILLALLCASGAAAPVVALRESHVAAAPALPETVAVSAASAVPASAPEFLDLSELDDPVPAVEATGPAPAPKGTEPGLTLDDRLRGLLGG